MTSPVRTPEQLAELFHTTYEQLAPQHGYTTRRDSAVPWPKVPEQNRKLMVHVAEVVLDRLTADSADINTPQLRQRLFDVLDEALRQHVPPSVIRNAAGVLYWVLDQASAQTSAQHGAALPVQVTRVPAGNTVPQRPHQFANPFLLCTVCQGQVTNVLRDGLSNVPCGHHGLDDVCPTWSPVDGCTCSRPHREARPAETAQGSDRG